MGLFSFLNKPTFPFTKRIVVTNTIKSYTPAINDKLKLWGKPNTNTVNIYLPKTVDGDGLLNSFQSSKIHKHLSNQNLNLKCYITYINKDTLAIIVVFSIKPKKNITTVVL